MAGKGHNRRKIFVLILANLAIVAVMLELVGLVVYYFKHHELFYARSSSEPIAAAPETPERPAAESLFLLHPFLGFIHRPSMPISRLADRDRIGRLLHGAATAPAWTDLRTNNYGFLSNRDYPYEAAPGEYVIGVFGGSVAQWFALQGSDRIRERLVGLPVLEGRNVVVLNFAQGGFKQPQQLQTLTYFLALGQRFDFVLNLDGFNEIALSHINHSNRIATSMPSAQHLVPLLHLLGSADHGPEAGEAVRRLREAEAELRRSERRSAANRSAGLQLLLDVLHARARARHDEALEALQAPPPDSGRSALVELSELPADYDLSRSLDDALTLWLNASLTMQSVCDANDLRYLEVIQPNQYFSSKRFSAQERRIAISGRSPYRLAVQQGYAALPAELRRVQGLGLHIRSAVALFDEVEAIVYSDDCCHYNQIGNELLADFVAEQIATLLASPSEARAGEPFSTDGWVTRAAPR